MIPSGPESAKWLTEEEKITAINRLKIDAAGTNEGGGTKLKHILQALTSPHVIGCSFSFVMAKLVLHALYSFLDCRAVDPH